MHCIRSYKSYLEEAVGKEPKPKAPSTYVVKKLRGDKILFGPAGKKACNDFIEESELKCFVEEVPDTEADAEYNLHVSHARAAYRQALYGRYSSELIELYEQVMASQGALVDMYDISYPTLLAAFAETLLKYKDLLYPIADEVAIVLGGTDTEQVEPTEETQ